MANIITLTEGKHWPADYIKTAVNAIKASKIGQQSWYSDQFIQQDVQTFANEFSPLSHKNSNLGFFMPIIRWFVEYSGESKQKYQEFIERKLDDVIRNLQVILNDNTIKDDEKVAIKTMSFADFKKLCKAHSNKITSIVIKKDDALHHLVKIDSYQQLHELYGGNKTGYKGQSEWCHTNGSSTYDGWTSGGKYAFFVIEREGWEKINPPDPKMTNAYDEYGMSLVAILVMIGSTELRNATLRWNHTVDPSVVAPGTSVDRAFLDWESLSKAVGFDVKAEVVVQLKEENAEIERLKKNVDVEFKKIDVIDGTTIPDKIKDVITHVDIPSNIIRIGERSFYGCSRLTSVTIPASVTCIGNYAFMRCVGLTSVTIPASVTCIGDGAFEGCSGLTSVTIPSSVTSIRASAFSYCSGLTSVSIPKSVTSVEDFAFGGCDRLESVTIPEGVTIIGEYAFFGCIRLKSVTIPSSVTRIEDYAFQDCGGMKTVTISSSAISIGDWAFYGCSGLKLEFKGKTIDEVKNMENYPFGLKESQIEASSNESLQISYWAHMLDEAFQIK